MSNPNAHETTSAAKTDPMQAITMSIKQRAEPGLTLAVLNVPSSSFPRRTWDESFRSRNLPFPVIGVKATSDEAMTVQNMEPHATSSLTTE